MIGFITTPETAAAITQAIRDAQTSRGLPVYWVLTGVPILSGPYAGQTFLPADDAILTTPLHGHPVQTPQDFPEFTQLVAMLGGLDSRVDVNPAEIAQPATP